MVRTRHHFLSQWPRLSWSQQQVWILSLGALLLLSIFEPTRLDVRLAHYFYDSELRDFPWRNHWFFSQLMHHGLKYISYLLGLLATLFCLYALRRPISWLPPRNALTAALGMALIPITLSTLKWVTNRHCPWDVIEFGGYAPYLKLLAMHSSDLKPGACFPAGHATAGFVWLIWAVVLRAHRPQWARRAFYLALLMGSLMGLGRMIQGAHFLSHTLWSLWFTWAAATALATLCRAELAPQANQADKARSSTSRTSDDKSAQRDTTDSAERMPS